VKNKVEQHACINFLDIKRNKIRFFTTSWNPYQEFWKKASRTPCLQDFLSTLVHLCDSQLKEYSLLADYATFRTTSLMYFELNLKLNDSIALMFKVNIM